MGGTWGHRGGDMGGVSYDDVVQRMAAHPLPRPRLWGRPHNTLSSQGCWTVGGGGVGGDTFVGGLPAHDVYHDRGGGIPL